jgi:nitrite reductase (cytochrome c-552)
MLKMQHPEFELFTSGLHYQSGVACADCHMPYVREGSVKVSDHWLRSPLVNINASCQTCHNYSEANSRRASARSRIARRPAAQHRRGALSRHRRHRGRARSRRDGRGTGGGAATAPLVADAVGLHLLGEQHRLPQPAGVGAGAGDAMNLARQAELAAYKVLAAKQGAAAAPMQLVSSE